MSFDRNAMRGPGGEARTPWAEDVLLKGALERVRKAEGDLRPGGVALAQRLRQLRLEVLSDRGEAPRGLLLGECRLEAAQLRQRVADALRFLASGDCTAASRCLMPVRTWIVVP